MLIKKLFLFVLLATTTLASVGQVTFSSSQTQGCTPLGIVLSVTSPSAGSITNYAWSITHPDGSVHTSANPEFVGILSEPGTYDVSLTINGNSTHSEPNFITVFANPTASLSVDDTEGCWPLCVNFTDQSTLGSAPITEWAWDFGNGQISSSQNPTYCYPQEGVFSPVFSVQDAHGCISNITMSALINVTSNFPNTQFNFTEPTTCNAPVVVTLQNTSVGQTALTNNWDFGDGSPSSASNSANTNHIYQSSGTFTACLTSTDLTGCSKTICHDVVILDQVQASFTTDVTSICLTNNVHFSSTTSPTPTSFQWDFNSDGIIESTQANPSYSYPAQGTFSPSLIIAYSPSCIDTLTQVDLIDVLAPLQPSFSSLDQTSCSIPFTTTITNTTLTTLPTTYQWFVNNAPAGTTNDLVYTFNSFDNYDIRLIASNSIGCEEQSNQTDFIQVALPTISFTPPLASCVGEEIQINNLQINSVDSVVAYNWDFNSDGLFDAFDQNPTYTYTAQGTFPVTLNITTQSGCTASYTSTQSVHVQANVDPAFTSNTTLSCAGQSVEFCVNYQPGNIYSWNFNDGFGWQNMLETETCISHDFQDTGYFDVTIMVFNSACNASNTVENYIYITPPVSKFDYGVSCSDVQTVAFEDQSIEATSLVWDFGDGTPVSNDNNPVHHYDNPGTYTVILTAINDALGCPDISQKVISVVEPSADINFSTNAGCPPLQVELSSPVNNTEWNIQISNGDNVHIQWLESVEQWFTQYSHDGQTDSLYFSESANYWPTISLEEEGCFDFEVTAIDENGCSITTQYNDAVCVAASPDFASFTTTILNSCDSLTVAFSPNNSALTLTTWSFGDGTSSNESSPTHTFLPPYNYNQPISVSLSATDLGGCTSSVQQDIDVFLPVIPQFSVSDNTICSGTTVQFNNITSGPATSYLWTFGDTQSNELNTSTEESPTHLYANEPGYYDVCLSADNGHGCVRTACMPQLIGIMNPTAEFTYNATINNCLFGVQFNNTTQGVETTIEWLFGDNQNGTGQQAFHTYPIGVYDVTLVVTNNHGCTDSLVVPDILNYGNVIGPYQTQLEEASCAPFTADFSAFNPNDTYFTYFWDFNDGGGDPSGSTTTTHDYLSAGTYCPSVILTDPNGCDVLISCINPIVVQEFTLNYSTPLPICFGDTINFQVANGTSYSWADSTTVAATNTLGEYLLFPQHSSDLVLTGYYADCVKIDTLHVTVNQLPEVVLTLNPSVCENESAFVLTGGVPTQGDGHYYVNGTESSLFDPSWTSNLNYEVVYQLVDSNGCVNADTSSIFIHQLPVVNFIEPNPRCADAEVFTLDTASPSGGVYIFDSLAVTTFDPSIGYGTHQLTYSYTDQFGCSNTADQHIVIYPLPEPTIAFDNTCLNVGLVVQNSSSIPTGSIAIAEWNFGVGGTQSGNSPSPVFFPEPGDYSFSAQLISDHGCLASVDSIVSVWTLPESHFDLSLGCQYSDLVFVDHSTISVGSIASLRWLVEDQDINSSDSLVYAFEGYGTLPISLVSVSDMGCTDTLSQTVVIYPVPVVSPEFDNACDEAVAAFNAAAYIPLGGIQSYHWTFGEGYNDDFTSVAENLFDGPGTYPFSLEVTSNMGCTTLYNDTITVYPLPTAEFILEQDHICANDGFDLIDVSSVPSNNSITSWTWQMGNDVISNEQNVTSHFNIPGLWDINLRVTTNVGCSSDTTVAGALQIYPRPTAGFHIRNNELDMISPVVKIDNTSSDDVVYWQYNFGDDQVGVFENGEHEYSQWGSYEIIQYVRNTFGCTDITRTTVNISPNLQVYIPNAFTPDENGHNEYFSPILSGDDVTLFEFLIFDRWGNKVFETKDVNTSWNGLIMNEGTPVQDGVYNWILKIRSASDPVIQSRNGFVMVMR